MVSAEPLKKEMTVYIKINAINMYVIILMSRMDLHAVITCYTEVGIIYKSASIQKSSL